MRKTLPTFVLILYFFNGFSYGAPPEIKRKRSKNVRLGNRGSALEKRASPFGQIEEVFVDTLKEDEEFGRRMQLVIQTLSIDLEVPIDDEIGESR